MAVDPLILAESLRPWRYAGVSALLFEEATGGILPADVPEAPPAFTPDSEFLTSAAKAKPEGTGGANVSSRRAHPQPSTASGFSIGENPAHPEKRNGKKPCLPFPAASGGKAEHAGAVLSEEMRDTPDNSMRDGLPEPWRTLLSRTAPAPIIWTYAELGDDLAGHGDKDRSACLRYIIGSLNLPKGTNSFWPVCLSQAAALAEGPPSSPVCRATGDKHFDQKRFFQAGLLKLNPKVVILLGIRAVELSELAVSLSTPFTQKIHKGVLYVLLPDFHTLLAKTVLKNQSCAFLRSCLSGMPLS